LIDAIRYLPDDILVKVDRASMAVSLETRVPFLDHEVAAYCWSLPMRFKVRSGNLKWLLRQVLYRYVPKEIVDRPKTGFAVPIDRWLRGPMKDWANDMLSVERLNRQDFFDPLMVQEVWHRHLLGHADHQRQLWAILMFQS